MNEFVWKFCYAVVVAFSLFAAWMIHATNLPPPGPRDTFTVKTDSHGEFLSLTTQSTRGATHGLIVESCPDHRDPVVTFKPTESVEQPLIATISDCSPDRDMSRPYRFDNCKDGRMPELTPMAAEPSARRTWNVNCSPNRVPSLQPGEHDRSV